MDTLEKRTQKTTKQVMNAVTRTLTYTHAYTHTRLTLQTLRTCRGIEMCAACEEVGGSGGRYANVCQ